MAELRAFRGVRYNQEIVGDLARVVAAPYDVIGPAAQAAYEARSPYNVVRLELGREGPADRKLDNRYTRAAALYAAWRREGVLRVDQAPSLYVYDESFDADIGPVTRRSLFAAVRLADWDERVILPHEFTLPKPKADRLSLLRATHTQFSPLMAMYDDTGAVREFLAAATAEPPMADFRLAPGDIAAAATEHRLWRVDRPSLLDQLSGALASQQLYIADGHHRYETALAYRDEQRRAGAGPDAPSEFALFALVAIDDPGLLVLPTHRMLRGIGPIDANRVLRALGRWFRIDEREVGPLAAPEPRAAAEALAREELPAELAGQPSFVALGLRPGYLVRLTLRPDVDLAAELPDVPPVLRNVDVVLLQRLILERTLGLEPAEVERGERIQYSRDPAEAAAAFASGEAPVVFFLQPSPVGQLRAVVQAGARFPQKTTYFYPKPVTGLVLFDEDLAW